MSDRRGHRKADRTIMALMLASILCNIVMFVWVDSEHNTLSDQQQELNVQRTDLGTQRKQALEGCRRLQIVRVEDNASHEADYNVYRVVLAETEAQIKAGVLVGQQLANSEAFLVPLKAAVQEKSWVPTTNCEKAVNRHGVSYVPPRPIPFVQKLPPQSAVTVSPSLFKP